MTKGKWRDKDGDPFTHSQRVIAIYTTKEEKEDIKQAAKRCNKSMSKYLLDLHLEKVNR